jgi:hypothetical protein
MSRADEFTARESAYIKACCLNRFNVRWMLKAPAQKNNEPARGSGKSGGKPPHSISVK